MSALRGEPARAARRAGARRPRGGRGWRPYACAPPNGQDVVHNRRYQLGVEVVLVLERDAGLEGEALERSGRAPAHLVEDFGLRRRCCRQSHPTVLMTSAARVDGVPASRGCEWLWLMKAKQLSIECVSAKQPSSPTSLPSLSSIRVPAWRIKLKMEFALASEMLPAAIRMRL